jgi:hypothetical protein
MLMKKTNFNFLIDVLFLLLLLILLEQRATGNSIHEWLGITISLIFIIHSLQHLNWIKCELRRFHTDGNKIKFILNILLFGVLVSIIISGLMISREVLPGISVHPGSHSFWRSLHDLSANLLLILTGLHLALNWKRILNYFNKKVNAGKTTQAQNQPSTLQDLTYSEKTSIRLNYEAKKIKQVLGSLKLIFILLLFSAGISTGWYYFSQNSQAKPATELVRSDDNGSPPAQYDRAPRRHHAGPGNNHHPGHRDQLSLTGMLPGMVQNISILFLLVFLTVMAREHFRSPKR